MNSKALHRAFAFLATLCAVPAAQAQTAPEKSASGEELSEVVVTGYRASLSNALEIKRNSDLVIDAIAGGDIGALPDVTIAESLIRLPGINGTRDRGNQSQASLRGLGPRLVLGLVNGREVASSEPNRNVRWEIYPSEVVSGVDVYKSQSADLVAGGVAGTIDIRTVRPLNYSGPQALLRGGVVYYQAGEDIPDYDPLGYRGSGSFTHSIGDNFAFNIGASVQRQKNGYPSFQGWGFNDGTINPGNATGDLNADGIPDPTVWGAQTEVKKLTEDRMGLSTALGWRIGDSGTINFDALYSKIEIDEDQNQAWYGRNGTSGNWANGSVGCYNAVGSSYAIFDDSVSRATLNNCYMSVTNTIARYTEDKELLVTGLNGEFEVGAWKLTGDLSYSEAQRTNRWAAFFTEVYPATTSFNMTWGRRPSLTTSSDPSDPTGQTVPSWVPGQSDGPDNLEDELTAVRVDLERDFEGAFSGLKFGARASEREKSYFRRQEFFAPITATLPASMFSSYSVKEFDAPPLLNGNFNDLVEAAYGGMPIDSDTVMPGSPWKVEESVLEAYVMGKFNASWGSVPFTGSFGARVVSTETTSTGFETVNGGAFVPVSIDSDYTEVLPSVNMMWKFGDDRQLRFGAARVISRPPLDELRATRQLWNTTPPPTGSGGNPLLEPFLGTQFDVSYEWYFKPESMVALALFYKDVDNHIGYTTDPVVIDSVTYAVTGPFNGNGGEVSGAELTFQMPFTEFFGIYMNYAFVDSNVYEFYPVTNPLPVEGFAQDTAAVDLWLSIAGLEARLGYKYHSPYTVIAGWNGGDVRELSAESLFDFSLSYQVNKTFGMRFQVNNLTDEPLRISRDNNLQRLGSFDVYGRRALLDFTFTF